MSSSEGTDVERAETGKEIKESVDRAQMALNRLDNICKNKALRGQTPEDTVAYQDALIDLDMAVMDAYRRLRKYLRVDLEDYWNIYVIGFDAGEPVVLGEYENEELDRAELEFAGQKRQIDVDDRDQIRYFESYQGQYDTYTETERRRFEGMEQVTKHVPRLLDPDDYRRALRVLDEARRKLGFTPKPTESTPRTEITEEMIEGIDEWRQENLPEKYLNGNSE